MIVQHYSAYANWARRLAAEELKTARIVAMATILGASASVEAAAVQEIAAQFGLVAAD